MSASEMFEKYPSSCPAAFALQNLYYTPPSFVTTFLNDTETIPTVPAHYGKIHASGTVAAFHTLLNSFPVLVGVTKGEGLLFWFLFFLFSAFLSRRIAKMTGTSFQGTSISRQGTSIALIVICINCSGITLFPILKNMGVEI